jgi:hypothetical protein
MKNNLSFPFSLHQKAASVDGKNGAHINVLKLIFDETLIRSQESGVWKFDINNLDLVWVVAMDKKERCDHNFPTIRV